MNKMIYILERVLFKSNNKILLILCMLSCALCFSDVAFGDVVYKKNITICKENILPIDLNKAIGISLTSNNGMWVDEEGKLVSNIFMLPEDANIQSYEFRYILKNDSFCGLNKEDELALEIRVIDEFVISIGEIIQPTCENPSGKVEINNYDSSLTYIFNPSGPNINSQGIIEYAQPGVEYSLYSTDGICSSYLVEFNIDSLPDDCNLLPCDELWNNITVNQLISPNNDGLNDVLIVDGLEQFYKQNCETVDNPVKLLVFNRWGALVYEKINYMKDEERFDAYSANSLDFLNKRRLPAGTYFYLIRTEGREVKNGYIYITGDNK